LIIEVDAIVRFVLLGRNTNYVLWYPFDEDDGDMKSRFTLQLTSASTSGSDTVQRGPSGRGINTSLATIPTVR
jgi:hypothetical protein